MSSDLNRATQPARDSKVPSAPQSGTRLRTQSAHDHHFLTRLARIDRAQTELALSLYYDAPLVKAIVDGADLPDHVDRVAVALEHSQKGPFIVVARDGHFVTCLGKGMSIGRLRVIPREQLDRVSAFLGTPLERKRAQQALERARVCWERRETFVPERPIGRNSPCPCGSGKKHKRCCDLANRE